MRRRDILHSHIAVPSPFPFPLRQLVGGRTDHWQGDLGMLSHVAAATSMLLGIYLGPRSPGGNGGREMTMSDTGL